MQGAVIPLPLREDLHLFESAPERDGTPTWAIQDPVSNRFYRIGWLEYECLLRWPGDPAAIAHDISRSTALDVDAELVEDFAQFLEQNHLVRPSSQGIERMKQRSNEPGWRHWRWWLHSYLFVRVPLVRPDRVLRRILPWVEPLFTRTALIILLCMTVLGLVLVARQWDVFTHSVMDLVSPSGIVGFVLALIISKALHELGHALVTTRQGLRVAHMGVAFLVMWPMLYTDTGESWRLRSHRQRLAISIAGVSVELALAGIATLAWALLDDGVLRQSMLYLATTAWILSLALNVSPFMRFDGYFILSDVLNFPNLHERAGAMARTRLRRMVLGLRDPDPEVLSPAAARNLTLFAFATWIYRLGVFLAIAWAVYTFFFKLLGIFLLVVEILWFVLRPIASELAVWKERWPEVTRPRRLVLYGLILVTLTLLAMPWAFKVDAPAVAHPERQQFVYSPSPAQLVDFQQPGFVSQGSVLATFQAPDLDAQRARTQATVQALEQRLAGIIADEQGRAHEQATIRRLHEQQAEFQAIQDEAGRLRIAAEFDGHWRDVPPDYHAGTWVDTQTLLGVLVDPSSWVIDAYVEQRTIDRLQPGAPARFHIHGHPRVVNAHVLFMDTTRTQRLSHTLLDSRYGGPISTQQAGRDEGAPVDALYRVRLKLAEPLPYQHEVRGTVHIDGEPRSLLWDGTRWLIGVLIRESGF